MFMVALTFLLPACKSYDDGVNPWNGGMTRVSVQMLATSQMAGFSATGRTASPIAGRTTSLTMGDSVAFESILLGVSKLKFELADTTHNDSTDCDDDREGSNSGPSRIENGDDGDDEDDEGDDDGDDDNDSTKLEFKGAFIVDLLNGTSTPDFGIEQVVPGVYSKIKIKLSPILPDSNSIFVKGTVFAGDTSYNIEFSSKMQMTLVIQSKHGITLDGSLNSILVTFDLDRFFEKINLASAHVDEDGVIRINPSFNPGTFAFLHLNLNSAMRCGKDDDHDGEIDD